MNMFRRYMASSFNRVHHLFKTRLMSTEANPKSSKGQHLLLIIPVAAFGLGTWQVKRLEWKRGLIKELEAKTQKDAVPLSSDILTPAKMREMDYRRVFVIGKFDHSKELFIGPRSLHSDDKAGGGLISGKPKSGYHVVTPFILDSGERILINRGWVSRENRNADARSEGQITDRMQVTGYIRSGHGRPTFVPKVPNDSLIWHYDDVASFSRLLDTSPVMIEADASSNVLGGPIGGQTRVHIRNEHVQYIITWYALSAATFFMYYQLRKRPAAMFKAGPTARE